MFGIGTTELFVILLVGILVLGPEHLPRIMRTVTKVMSDVRRISTDFQRTVNLEVNREEWEQNRAEEEVKKKKKKAAAALKQTPAAEEAPGQTDGQAASSRPLDPLEAENAAAASGTGKEESPAAGREERA